MTISKQSIQAGMSSWVKQHTCQNGYWITLDTPYIEKYKPDAIKFEQTVGKFAVRLNNYCYGRAFRRKEKRLNIIGSLGVGHFMDRPHAHLIVQHDSDVQRSFVEVEQKCREIWYEVTNARGDIFGSLVDIQPIGDAENRQKYAASHISIYDDQYGRVVMF